MRFRRIVESVAVEVGVVRFEPSSEKTREHEPVVHRDREVICYVAKGSGFLRLGNDTDREVRTGTICHIPANTAHDFYAVGDVMVLVYVLAKAEASGRS